MKVNCQKCGYEWDTASRMSMVTCPNCNYKTPRTGEVNTTREVKMDPRSTQDKGPREVSIMNMNRKWTGVIALIAVIAIGAWAVMVYLPEGDPEPVEGPIWGSGLTGYVAGEGGIHAVYIADPNETLDGDPTGWILGTQYFVKFDDNGQSGEIDYDTDFVIVVHAGGEEAEMANLDAENIRVELETTGDLTIAAENIQGTGFTWTDVDVEGGKIEVTAICDAGGHNYQLGADESFDWTVNVYLWG